MRPSSPLTHTYIRRLADVLRQAAVVCMDPRWQPCLMAVMRYAAIATRGACRRALLAEHFGEPPPPCEGDGMCDLCRRRKDLSITAATAACSQPAAPSAMRGDGEEDITDAALLLLQTLQVRRRIALLHAHSEGHRLCCLSSACETGLPVEQARHYLAAATIPCCCCCCCCCCLGVAVRCGAGAQER